MYYFQISRCNSTCDGWKKDPAPRSGEGWVVAPKWPGCSGTIPVGPMSVEGSRGTGRFTFLLTSWIGHPAFSP